MARAFVILMVLWAGALGGFLLLKNTPKSSPWYGLRDLLWMLLMACAVVGVLGLVAAVTGIISVRDTPFR